MTALAPALQAFFTSGLQGERGASPATVAAYRDAWVLLIGYAGTASGKPPHELGFADVTAEVVSGFLTYLETGRGNSVTTRNARLAAVHSLFAWAAHRYPEHAGDISRVLAIPPKRGQRTDLTYLDPGEVTALLAAPDRTTKAGRRDHSLLQTAVTTGMRVSELTGLKTADVHLGTAPHTVCRGKGRKNRTTPLDADTVAVLKTHLAETGASPAGFVFPTRTGTRMSRDAVAARLAKHVASAATTCPSLAGTPVTPHTLRHTAAMRLLHAGIDVTVIALWLGHESIETTYIYLHADMKNQGGGARQDHTNRNQGRAVRARRHPPQLPQGPLIMPTSGPRSPPLHGLAPATSA